MNKAGESFDEVWEKLKAEDKTGTFEKAEVLSFISCEALEYAYNSGYATAKAEFERPQGEWINHRNDYGHNIADCSLCGKAMQWHDEDEDGIPRYCWYCGAKMYKEDNNGPA